MTNVYGLIAHVHQVGMTGKASKPLVPVVGTDTNNCVLLGVENGPVPVSPQFQEALIQLLHETYNLSHRMEVQVFTGVVDVCLAVNFLFYKTGKGNVPILILEGGVDSTGIRLLRAKA